MSAAPSRGSLPGAAVVRVEWLPGSDRLRGRCHCGAEAEGEDPGAMWEWLLAHPRHPRGGPGVPPAPAELPPPPAHLTSGPRRRVPVPV